MFKKVLTIMVALVAVVALASCKKDQPKERTYVADGSYTAFKSEVYNGNPQVTSVTVVIKNDKVQSYYINCTQGAAIKDAEGVQTGAQFNAKSKKELGYGYKMHYYSLGATSEEDYKAKLTEAGKLEWFEQANAIEAAWLANGAESVTVGEGNVINNVTGVTIKDGGYIELAKAAVQQAKDGVVKAYATYEDDLIFATAKVDKDGKLSEVVLDTLQGQYSDAWSFKAQTKQELKYGYKMHYYSLGATSEEDYKAKLAESGKLEWFEQADLIVKEFLAKGTLTITEGKVANIAGVSINDNQYLKVLTALKNCVK